VLVEEVHLDLVGHLQVGPAQQRRDDLLGGHTVAEADGDAGGAVGRLVVVVDDAGEVALVDRVADRRDELLGGARGGVGVGSEVSAAAGGRGPTPRRPRAAPPHGRRQR
jgi:hypothetical protein